jgi:hypothetical protein
MLQLSYHHASENANENGRLATVSPGAGCLLSHFIVTW